MTPAPDPRIDDAAARDRIRNSLRESLVVEASAGTGKTTELVSRLVNILASGATTVNHVAAVTFTNKAAGELKLRLRQELDRARESATDALRRAHIEHALEHLEEASIGTIHSFCAQILRERPVEAKVDPAFEEISDQQAGRIYERAFRAWLEQKLTEGAPGLRRALLRLAWRESWDNSPPVDQLQYAGWKLIEWRDHPTPWREVPFDRNTEIDRLVEQVTLVAEAASRCPKPNDNLVRSLWPAQSLRSWIERAEAATRSRDHDTVESFLIKLHRELKKDTKKGSGFFSASVPREQVVLARDQLIQNLDRFQQAADADLASMLRGEMWGLVERYDALKRRSGKLDFVDLLLIARDLVRGNREVREYLQQKFTHILIDEFQDTDPLQAEILLLLAADDPSQTNWLEARPKPGKLFVVGDPKQSVYKFRRADVVLYRAIRDSLVERGAGVVQLTTSFRALAPIQECVNAAFDPEMQDDPEAGQAGYAPLRGGRDAIDGQPGIVVLPAPKPYGSTRVSKQAINQCLPGAVVAFVDWLVNESQWKVRDLEHPENRIEIQYRHICLLFRRFTNLGADITRDYVRQFESREIPHVLVGSKSFHSREEVETLRAALNAIEWPEDELSVFATLKGSLFAVSDEALLRYRHLAGKLHPFRAVPENLPKELQPAADALALLADLHRARNRKPIADTLNSLLEATRAHAGFALRPAGHQVLANVYRVRDLARNFELTGGISFRGFIEELEAQADKADSAEAPVLEEGADGVRLMTVHSAKGLEFPVVILADITANIAAADPDRFVDGRAGLCATRLIRCAPWELRDNEARERLREKAEGVRVAYVAATRARDLLVVPAVGDEKLEASWVGPLNKAIYPAPARYRNSSTAEGCPKFGEATVIDRAAFMPEEPSVRPGRHAPEQGGHEVVWWDPLTLKLAAPENFGLRQQEILSEIPGEEAPGWAAYREWKAARDLVTGRALAPEFNLFTATESAAAPQDFRVAITVHEIAKAAGRPAGARFGTLVHTILSDAALDASADALQELARLHGRVLGATPQEIEHAASAAVSALRHPLLESARQSKRVHRELPVTLKLEDARTLEGVIDLAYETGAGQWSIVDFKTDADLAPNREKYQRQLHWYALALARLKAARVAAHLLSC